MAAGGRPKFMFFWGHTKKAGQAVGPWLFSQWFDAPFEHEGHRYRTAEHWMMAGKARLFGDDETLASILAARTPGEAKALGRRVRGFDEDTWNAHRMAIVVEGSVLKFSSDPELRDFLEATSSRVLVEASPLDRIWGIGLAADDPNATRPEKWQGLNLLGFALMEARTRL